MVQLIALTVMVGNFEMPGCFHFAGKMIIYRKDVGNFLADLLTSDTNAENSGGLMT